MTTNDEVLDPVTSRMPDVPPQPGSRHDPAQVLLTRVGLQIPAELSYDDWARAGHRLSGIVDSSSWCLGDWLVYGKKHYADRYKRAIDAAGLQYQTLRNYAWVSRRFELHRRRPRLTFQHHAEVASLPLRDQERLLDEAEQQMWTTKQLRTRIRDERTVHTSETGNPVIIPRIEVPDARLAWWREAADQSGMPFEDWVRVTLDGAAEEALEDDRTDHMASRRLPGAGAAPESRDV